MTEFWPLKLGAFSVPMLQGVLEKCVCTNHAPWLRLKVNFLRSLHSRFVVVKQTAELFCL